VSIEVVAASSLAEVSWVSADRPQVRGVVALVRGDRPALAFTYADAETARSVAAAPQFALSLTEQRSTGREFRPLLITGRPYLTEDPAGDVFAAELVTQELRRYPPSRIYADSPLLMREHWWYLPRLIVELEVERVEPVSTRVREADHLLVVADRTTPVVRRAARPGVHDPAVERLLVEVEGEPPAPGPAVLFGQDASFPDLELWTQWRYRGRWDGAALVVEEAPARVGLGRPLGLLQRWRRQRDLQRRCLAAIPTP
jgi:hypothetical protein